MADSGTLAIVSGSYECESCRHTIALRVGDVAPKCPECRHGTDWRLKAGAEGSTPAAPGSGRVPTDA